MRYTAGLDASDAVFLTERDLAQGDAVRLSGFRIERKDERVRAVADLSWEDCDREEASLYFEVDESHADGMVANPDAFLVAVAIPALRFGERRIAIDGAVCPVLLEGLETALSIVAAWHYPTLERIPLIEASGRRPSLPSRRTDRAGVFFSGGIDSYATIRSNMLTYPEWHPNRFREGVLVLGLEQDHPGRFQYVADTLERAADELGLTFTTLVTNIYDLYRMEDKRDGYRFWYHQLEGSTLAAVGHSLAHRLGSVAISATLSPRTVVLAPRTLVPAGSHLMLDHCYASGDLRIHHAGAGLSRLEKTALVADWGLASGHLRICNQSRYYEASALNCGRCKKCLFTKLAFAALGREDMLAAFVNEDLSAALVSQRVYVRDVHDLDLCSELVTPLAARGHEKVARVLRRQVQLYRLLGPHVGLRRLRARALRRMRRLFGRRPGPPRTLEPPARA